VSGWWLRASGAEKLRARAAIGRFWAAPNFTVSEHQCTASHPHS